MGSTTAPLPAGSRTYEAVTGLFMQDDPRTNWSSFDYMKHNFGLIDQDYSTGSSSSSSSSDSETPWLRFAKYLAHLQSTAPSRVSYKLFYLGRHGEGYHNVAESFYGTEAWDDYWSKLEGNGTIFWADAHLTDLGQQQARANHAFVSDQLAGAKMPAPERYYVSPLYRCLQTAQGTYQGLELPEERPFDPAVKEMAREVLGEHTCDRRSSKSYIVEHFPAWRIEDGFSEEDELWRADHRETWAEHDVRTQALLDDVFKNDAEAAYISITSHSGSIASFLRVVKHRDFRLQTGGMIPVLVKATRQS